jgi:hypothetical protein
MSAMAALGRLLSTVGWLWFVAGIAAPIFDLDRVNVFPGLILILAGRVIRTQAKRREAEEQPAEVAPETADRPLNTERTRSDPLPEPLPAPPPPPRPVTPATPPVTTETAEPAEAVEVAEPIVSRLRSASSSRPTTETGDEPISTDRAGDGLLTSEEMIARARERWGRRP